MVLWIMPLPKACLDFCHWSLRCKGWRSGSTTYWCQYQPGQSVNLNLLDSHDTIASLARLVNQGQAPCPTAPTNDLCRESLSTMGQNWPWKVATTLDCRRCFESGMTVSGTRLSMIRCAISLAFVRKKSCRGKRSYWGWWPSLLLSRYVGQKWTLIINLGPETSRNRSHQLALPWLRINSNQWLCHL